MKAKISGMVITTYERDSKDRNGNPTRIAMADMYIDHAIVKIARVDASFQAGCMMTDVPVNIYSNDYGLSVVFDSTAPAPVARVK